MREKNHGNNILWRLNSVSTKKNYEAKQTNKKTYRCVKAFNICPVKYCIWWMLTVSRGFYSFFLKSFCFLKIFKLERK